MALFVNRTRGPKWFTREFIAPSTDQEEESLEIWEAFLISRMILTSLTPLKYQFTFLGYQPNLISQ